MDDGYPCERFNVARTTHHTRDNFSPPRSSLHFFIHLEREKKDNHAGEGMCNEWFGVFLL